MNNLQSLSDTIAADGLMPHGYCLSWSPGLLSLHVVSDLFIVLAYYSIPITLIYFTRKRKDLPYPLLFWLFSIFIVACGTTHLLSAVTIWIPLYWLDGMVKALTAVISVAAAILMYKVIPLALKLRSPVQLEMEIKERKHAESLLFKQKQFSEDIITSLPGIFYMLDTQGRFVQVNKQFLEVSGYTQSEFDSMNALDFFEGEEKNLIANKIKETFEVGDVTVEAMFVTKSGKQIPYSFTGHTTNIDNQLYLIGIGTDISASKHKEQELKKYKDIIDSTDDAVISKSLTGTIESWNKGAERVFGYTANETIGQPIQMLIPPDCLDDESGTLARVARGESVPQHETVRRHKDGRLIYISNTVCPILDGQGNVIGASKIARDITERKLAEKEIDKLNKSLESKVIERTAKLEAINKDLESFSYSISHDLRSPLRAISGFSKILQEDYADKLDAEGNRLLNVVGNNAKKMGNLIDDILAFSRAGREEVEHTAINIKQMTEDVWEELKPSTNGRDIQLEIRALPSASGDIASIHQVIFNLLSNALKFTQPRSPALIEVESYVHEDENVYFVKDNGVGFDMQYASMLFGVFKRLHGADEFEGTGIGLAIVKRIINKHDGRVWAIGKPNEGATFYFTLPRGENHDS